ncbi:MAG: hypothetical protein NTW86_20115 [Candidatus Sumerlaeota bacterium]|nr:hypothetical protein [Candidatus Sumerlaeota bacterium]
MLRKAVTLTAASFALLAAVAWADGESAGKSDAEHIVKIQAATNKAQVNEYIPVVYDLKHVNPYDVVRWIHRTIQVEEGAVFTFASPDGNSGKVLVVCTKEQVPYLDQLMKEIDKPNLTTSTGVAKTYRLLKHRSVADPEHIDTLTAYGQKGSFKAVTDPQTNAVYLEDTPVAQEDLLKMYNEQFDVPTPEVACEVTIYEVNVSNDGALGLDFAAWKNGPGRNLFALGGFTEYETEHNMGESISGGPLDGGGYLNPSPLYDSGSNLLGLPGHRMSSNGYNVAYYYQVPSAYFDYLTVKGKAQVVGKTRLAVLNAHQGSISTGEQILFYLTQNGPAPTGGLRPPDYPLDPLNKASRGDQMLRADITPNTQYAIPLQQINVPNTNLTLPWLVRNDRLVNGPIYPDNRTVVGQQTARAVGGQSLQGFTYDRATGQTVALNRNIGAAEAGVFLDVIPVIADDKITFDLAYSVVTLTGFDAEGRPQLASRADKGQVQVKDGSELLLGGITRDARVQKTQKVPILGSIPVLGYWFGGEVTTAQKSMVVIVMKNTVVKNFNTVQGEDADLLAKVKGEQPAPLPADEYGWDMYLFDRQPRQ